MFFYCFHRKNPPNIFYIGNILHFYNKRTYVLIVKNKGANLIAPFKIKIVLYIDLNNNLGGLSFYEDASGDKYVVGADSVPKKLGSLGSGNFKVIVTQTNTLSAWEDHTRRGVLIYIYKNNELVHSEIILDIHALNTYLQYYPAGSYTIYDED